MGRQALQGSLGIVRFQGEEGHIERPVGQGFFNRGADERLRQAVFLPQQVQAQTALAQLLRHAGLFQENHLLPVQRQAAANVGADRAGAEDQPMQRACHRSHHSLPSR